MIPLFARRPTWRQSGNLLGSMSLVFFTICALILLCPVAVNAADEDKKSEFQVWHCHWNRSVYANTPFTSTTADEASQTSALPIPASGK